MIDVVLATHNAHKVEEFRSILEGLNVSGYGGPEPVEDGTSFAENALIKARAAAAHTGKIALADDSGICVDVLGGAPGIFSARWAGKNAGSDANLELLLEQLADIADAHRAAAFHCTIALVVPETVLRGGFETTVEGVWPGRLRRERGGSNGFGYDPIFEPEGSSVTAAELTSEQKNADSHRARAFRELIPHITRLRDELA